jgi:hypothetical protein
MVDPIARMLEAFRLDGGLWVMLGAWRDDAVVSAPPFDAVPLELSVLWATKAR